MGAYGFIAVSDSSELQFLLRSRERTQALPYTYGSLLIEFAITGIWMGETIGAETKAHHWIIVQTHQTLDIYTRWQDEDRFPERGKYKAFMGANKVFRMQYVSQTGYGVILNEKSFKMLQWVWALLNGTSVPYYDVLFQRFDGGLKQFEVDFLLVLYEDKSVVKRLSDLPYA